MESEPVQMALSHTVATDGGVNTESTEDTATDECDDCAALPGTFPCFSCYDPEADYDARILTGDSQ
jgi:hypothetical protein